MLALAAVVFLGACSADQTDFKRETENFLKHDERVASATGIAFTKAECQAPVSTKVGTEYACVATGVDGSTWDLAATITTKARFEIFDYKVRT
ncbi:MAG: hypothetical protein JWM12_2116 [Ilumatobacteraceae bacterium]|nr:hypothetical protein [Ilumatobacteraceae bacterium]